MLFRSCNWAIDLWPDVYTGDDAVKATMRQHGVKSWGPRTDIKAVQSMLQHHAELQVA